MNTFANTRNQGCKLPTKESIVGKVHEWLDENVIDEIISETDTSIRYFTGCDERVLYFPETDSDDRLRCSIIADSHVKEHINLNALSTFLYQHIDYNSLMCLDTIALVWDKYDKEGDLIPQEARKALYNKYNDEYALECGDDFLGLCWEERSTVILNVSEMMKMADELWEHPRRTELYAPVGLDNWHNRDDVFKDVFLTTVCHECRHLLYEANEFVQIMPNDDDAEYPVIGAEEYMVEEYGNQEAYHLYHNDSARTLIDKMVLPQKEKSRAVERD